MRTRLLLTLSLSLTLGCQMVAPTQTGSRPHVATRHTAPAEPTVDDTALPPVDGTMAAAADLTRVIAQRGTPTELVGKVKLLGNNGGGLISNNGGGLISNNGGGLVSDKGLGYSTLAAPEEAALTDADVVVVDAEGHVLVDENDQPLTARTDDEGHYHLSAVLPEENLLLRVTLFPKEGGEGRLLAFLPRKDDPAVTEVDINTATSLGAAYVLDKYVQKRQEVLDRLPAKEAKALQADMESARALLGDKTPSYKPEDLVAQAEKLRQEAPALDTTLERIRSLLLAGQKNLGAGLKATEVPLALPLALAFTPDGEMLIAEASASRIRRVAADGTVSVYAGRGAIGDGSASNFGGINAMAYGPDGALYVSESLSNRVQKITPDGRVVPIAGDTLRKQGPVGGPATATSLVIPAGLAVAADGRIWIGEIPTEVDVDALNGRLLYVDADGVLHQEPTPAGWTEAEISGLAVAADGTLYALDNETNQLAKKPPGGTWTLLTDKLIAGAYSRLLITPDGTLYVSESAGNRVSKVSPDGTVEAIAGTGLPGYSGDGGPAAAAQLSDPSGMAFKDGTLYVADSGNGLVRAIDASGTIRTVAGTQALTQQGDALALGVNQPASLAVDSQGRLVFAEIASATIKRLDNQQIAVIAGTSRGASGDGGPASQAAFDTLGGIAYAGETLYVVDASRIRRIDPSGVVTTVAGSQRVGWSPLRTQPATQALFGQLTGLAMGPDGLPYWADLDHHAVMRLTADGQVEIVAGAVDGTYGDAGDGGPASASKLNKPLGLAFDKAGNLYIADAGNFRIRKVDRDGVISTVAGLPFFEAIAKLSGTRDEEGIDAKQAVIVAPAGMAFDEAGNMYVAEIGTTGLTVFQGSGAIPIGTLPDTPALIRKITPDGLITTVAGEGTSLLADPANDNGLRIPVDIAFDAEGRLVIADSGTNQIKLLPASAL